FVSKGELHYAGVRRLGQFTESGRCGQAQIRRVEVDVVEDVEGFAAHAYAVAFPRHTEALADGRVEIDRTGDAHDAAGADRSGILAFEGLHGRRAGKDARDSFFVGVHVIGGHGSAFAQDADRRGHVVGGIETGVRDIDWGAGAERAEQRNLPTADDGVGPAGHGFEEMFVMVEGQFDDRVGGDVVADIEGGWPAV